LASIEVVFLFKTFFSSLGKYESTIEVNRLESEKSFEKVIAFLCIPGFTASKQAFTHLNNNISDGEYTFEGGILLLLYFCWISEDFCPYILLG
jgi:hypothetical protein